ncbi:HD domain-containing protein [Paludisphaera mucosa]|uniref:HD domain-containing protein n=1 Tax=Paludisphaera mucosa TaxID=3030827 RepID=A0ABT6FJE2_9BACT|nr:HD domain-containing protein [Paludisphaera mucosa]MDG3007654.1 HD domain-containing protein [Paludisphaera mucosa]
MERQALIQALEAAFARLADARDAGHDVHHARRVRDNAMRIADREGGDRVVLLAAAYLHDLVSPPKDSPDRARASALSAEAAGPVLRELGLDEERVAGAQHAIHAHSFSAGVETKTIEARILQDADRLEALGAIGVARTFYTAGLMNSAMFDADDPFAASRPLDDRRYALDHFAAKLLKLPATMKTEAGRALAEERLGVMRAFLDAIAAELGVAAGW